MKAPIEFEDGSVLIADISEAVKQCPICKGAGTIPKDNKDILAEDMKELSEAGFSYQRIADLMGFKSTDTVHYYLKRRKK